MGLPSAVLKHWDPMIGLDLHLAINPGGPPPLFVTPVPYTPHVVGGVLMWGPWGLFGKGKSEPSVQTFHGDVMLRGTDMGHFIPHVSIPPTNLLMPVWIALSSSKTEFGVASVRCSGGPVAVAAPNPIPWLGVNLNCDDPCSLPTGVVIGINTHFAGFTVGDFIAGLVMMGIDMLISFLMSKIPFGKYLAGRLAGPIASRLSGEVTEAVLGRITTVLAPLVGGALGVPLGQIPGAVDGLLGSEGRSITDIAYDGIANSINDYFNSPAVDERP